MYEELSKFIDNEKYVMSHCLIKSSGSYPSSGCGLNSGALPGRGSTFLRLNEGI